MNGKDWAWLAAAAVVLVFFRLHAFSLPLETDECNYAYIGGRLLAGDRLYVDVWDHQPPGVFVMFAAVRAVFGRSQEVFRWWSAAFSLVSLGLIFHIMRRHYSLEAAALAAVVFAITSSDPGAAGEGCNREIYMNAFALGAVACLLARVGSLRSRLLAAGLLLGVSSTLKTVVAAQWVVLAFWSSVRAWADARTSGSPALRAAAAGFGVDDRSGRSAASVSRDVPRARSPIWAALESVVWMAAGPALVWAGVFLYYAATDRFGVFIDAAFTFNVGYSGVEHGFFKRYLDFATVKPYVFQSAKPLWIAAAAAFPALLWFGRRRLTSEDGALLAYAFGSFHAVCLPGLYWPHYYYLLVPPVILICGALYQRTVVVRDGSPARRVARGGHRITGRLLTAAWVGCVLWFSLRYYLLVDPVRITAPRYDYRQQWARAQGYRVGRVTSPGDTVFVWGKDAGVYYYAQRRCASRYTMVGALEPDAVGYRRRRRTLLRELRTRRPRIVLVVEEEFDALREFLQAHYLVAGLDRDDDDPDKVIMLALMDREHPVERVDWEWRAPK